MMMRSLQWCYPRVLKEAHLRQGGKKAKTAWSTAVLPLIIASPLLLNSSPIPQILFFVWHFTQTHHPFFLFLSSLPFFLFLFYWLPFSQKLFFNTLRQISPFTFLHFSVLKFVVNPFFSLLFNLLNKSHSFSLTNRPLSYFEYFSYFSSGHFTLPSFAPFFSLIFPYFPFFSTC